MYILHFYVLLDFVVLAGSFFRPEFCAFYKYFIIYHLPVVDTWCTFLLLFIDDVLFIESYIIA